MQMPLRIREASPQF